MTSPIDLVLQGSPLAGSPTGLVFGADAVVVVPGTNLVYSALPVVGMPLELVFEADLDAELPPATLELAQLSAVLPIPGAAIVVLESVAVTINAQLPGPGASLNAVYVSQTSRPTVAHVTALAQVAQQTSTGFADKTHIAQLRATSTTGVFTEATDSRTGTRLRFTNALRTDRNTDSRFEDAKRTQSVTLRSEFDDADRGKRRAIEGRYQDAKAVQPRQLHSRFQDGIRTRRNWVRGTSQMAAPRTFGYQGGAGPARALPIYNRGRFQDARKVPPGVHTSPPVIPGPQPCYLPSGELIFADPTHGTNLIFYCGIYTPPVIAPGALLSILPARFYLTAHTIFAERLPDLVDVPLFDASISTDSGSYCWTLQASGPASLFEQLAPAEGLPVQLRVTLDGIPWVFAIDSISRTQGFGKTGVSFTGRSVTALVGAPYLRAVSRDNSTNDRLAQQLAEDALNLTGVGLDWGLTDWLVPTGAWSHQGTPLEAVQAIVQAAGGYLQSHRSAPTLLTRHPYSQRAGDQPGAPWGWMTGPADVELAPDAIITQGIDRRDGADVNAIYVSGTSHGVLALVKRSGSAADKLASMATDPLITHADAARQRGLAALGKGGPQYDVRLDLPVLTGLGQPGVLDVGQLVQVNTTAPWRGRVRSVSVSAKRPSLRQTITLERHL